VMASDAKLLPTGVLLLPADRFIAISEHASPVCDPVPPSK